MSWFNRNNRKLKKRNRVVKRRGLSAERLIFWSKRFGLTLGLIVFIAWLGVWFFMSDASSRFYDWSQANVISLTSDLGIQTTNILIEGRDYVDVDALRAIIDMKKGDPLLAFNPDNVKNRIEKLAWVKSAQVERRLPDTIFIKLNERQPTALWQRNKRLSLIDQEGVILTEHDLERFKDYIILTGKEVPSKSRELLSLLKAEPILYERVEAATLVSDRRWDLRLQAGIIVKLPEVEIPLALRRLVSIQEEEGLMDKNVEVIDLRDGNRITVRTSPGTLQEYKATYQPVSHSTDAI